MTNLESFNEEIGKKHAKEDQAKADKVALLKTENFSQSKIKELDYAAKFLDALYDDMKDENFDDLNEGFDSVMSRFRDLASNKVMQVSQSYLDVIEAGLKDREATKYNAAMKAVRELKEIILEAIKE